MFEKRDLLVFEHQVVTSVVVRELLDDCFLFFVVFVVRRRFMFMRVSLFVLSVFWMMIFCSFSDVQRYNQFFLVDSGIGVFLLCFFLVQMKMNE